MSATLVDHDVSDAARRRHVRAHRPSGASTPRAPGARAATSAPWHRPHPALLVAKRSIDVAGSALLLVALAPLFLVIALAILVGEGRPVLFRQVRVGRDGQPFTIVKFRSMVRGADELRVDMAAQNERTGPLFKANDDPRATPIGRLLRITSLDELPQLVNVLHGTMSLVGPRPALYGERAQFPAHVLERERVRPGITGLWQVKARLHPDFESYCHHDLEYVRTWTLRRDLLLLAATPFVVLHHTLLRATVRTSVLTIDGTPVLALVASVDADGVAS